MTIVKSGKGDKTKIDPRKHEHHKRDTKEDKETKKQK
jgi:hypothetical protein